MKTPKKKIVVVFTAPLKDLSDEQIAELGTERDSKMIPCGCSENISKYHCERFGCLRETL